MRIAWLGTKRRCASTAIPTPLVALKIADRRVQRRHPFRLGGTEPVCEAYD